MHWAAGADNLSVLQLLLSYQPDLEASDAMGWTPLLVAASSGHKQNVAELLDVGAKLDAVNDKGQGALHYAASKGNVPVSYSFRWRGADNSLLGCSFNVELM